MSENKEVPTGFKDLLSNMMARRWYITALVLGGFMLIIGGMFVAIINKNEIAGEDAWLKYISKKDKFIKLNSIGSVYYFLIN